MEWNEYLDEFEVDWKLAGKSAHCARSYRSSLRQLGEFLGEEELSLGYVKRWLAESASKPQANNRARAVRAFGRWACANDGPPMDWWHRVPCPQLKAKPQPTVTEEVYERVIAEVSGLDKLIIELLWCTGCRVSELGRLEWRHLDFDERFAVVEQSKTGRPRRVPLSVLACRLLRRHGKRTGTVLGLGPQGVRTRVKRLNVPSPHAWRRGWAVRSLRCGVSQTSVQSAGGWASGAMVSRYTSALAGELAIDEFRDKIT